MAEDVSLGAAPRARVSPAAMPTIVTAKTPTLAAVRAASMGVTSNVTPRHAPARSSAVTFAALVSAVSLAAVSGFFGIIGMTAIFAAAAIPIMVMVGALEAAKLVTCAWLTRHWRVTPLLLRAPLTVMVLALMTLTSSFIDVLANVVVVGWNLG